MQLEIYSVREGRTPRLERALDAEGTPEGLRQALDQAGLYADWDRTAYVFDTGEWRAGRAESLVAIVADAWRIVVERDAEGEVCDGYETTEDMPYGFRLIGWDGRYVECREPEDPREGPTEGSFRRDPGFYKSFFSDLLRTDKAGELGREGILGQLDKLFMRFLKPRWKGKGSAPVPALEFEEHLAELNLAGEGDLAEGMRQTIGALRETTVEILHALPEEDVLGSLGDMGLPAIRFNDDVRAGVLDGLSQAEYDRLLAGVNSLSHLWRGEKKASVVELAWGAMAMRGAGFDPLPAIGAVYGRLDELERKGGKK